MAHHARPHVSIRRWTGLVCLVWAIAGCDQEASSTVIPVAAIGLVVLSVLAPVVRTVWVHLSYREEHAKAQASAVGLHLPANFNRGSFDGECTFAFVDPLSKDPGLHYPASLARTTTFVAHIQGDNDSVLALATTDSNIAHRFIRSTTLQNATRALLYSCTGLRATREGVALSRTENGFWGPEHNVGRFRELAVVIAEIRAAQSAGPDEQHALMTRHSTTRAGAADRSALTFALEVSDAGVIEHRSDLFGHLRGRPFRVAMDDDSISIRVDLDDAIEHANPSAPTSLPLRNDPTRDGAEIELTFKPGRAGTRADICKALGLPDHDAPGYRPLVTDHRPDRHEGGMAYEPAVTYSDLWVSNDTNDTTGHDNH